MLVKAIKRAWERFTAKKIVEKQDGIKFVIFLDKTGIQIDRHCYVRGWRVTEQDMIDDFEEMFLNGRRQRRRGKKNNCRINKIFDDIKEISNGWKPYQ